jgi:hypothetical protein
MTIFRSAYDTLACSGFVMDRIEHGIEAVLHTGHLQPIPESGARMLAGGAAVADAVPAFAHPVVLKSKDLAGDVVVDVRAFGKYDPHQGQFVVRNKGDFAFTVLRGKINQVWTKEAPRLLLNVNPLGMRMFASWISENVARRFDLNPKEQTNLQILAAFYYYSLFMEQHPFSSTEKHKHAAAVIKATGINGSLVMDVVERFEQPIASITEFCAVASEVTESVRLKDLTDGLLIALLGGTWYGAGGNAKEVLAVALEHPPTWLAIVATAANDRSYKNSYITKLLERLDRRDKGQTFVRALSVTLQAAHS